MLQSLNSFVLYFVLFDRITRREVRFVSINGMRKIYHNCNVIKQATVTQSRHNLITAACNPLFSSDTEFRNT